MVDRRDKEMLKAFEAAFNSKITELRKHQKPGEPDGILLTSDITENGSRLLMAMGKPPLQKDRTRGRYKRPFTSRQKTQEVAAPTDCTAPVNEWNGRQTQPVICTNKNCLAYCAESKATCPICGAATRAYGPTALIFTRSNSVHAANSGDKINTKNENETKLNEMEVSNEMDTRRYTASAWLHAKDIYGHMTVTINDCAEEIFRDGVEKLVLSFDETGQRLILNRTNILILQKLFGLESDRWIGKQVSLTSEKVRFKDEWVDSIVVNEAPTHERPEDEGPEEKDFEDEFVEEGVDDTSTPF